MKRTLNLDEAAAYLGVSKRTIYNRIRDGKIHVERADHAPYAPWRVLTASLQARRVPDDERFVTVVQRG